MQKEHKNLDTRNVEVDLKSQPFLLFSTKVSFFFIFYFL